MEKKMKRNMREKNKIQVQINNMTKDLKYSYSYIGEINRKIDILEQIALGYPKSSNMTAKNEGEIYDAIMDAIRLFGKSDDFALRFVQLPDYSLIREIKSNPENTLSFSFKGRNLEISHFESDDFIITTSPKPIDNIFSYIVIKKIIASHTIEDIEMMKTLATQALFLFVFTRNKKYVRLHSLISEKK